MSTYASVGIAPHRMSFGCYRQTLWSWLIGTAFFFGEIGAGLFLVSLLTQHWVGMALGYCIVVIGKNSAHLAYLGRPARFWRAALRPDRSWIARGIWATGFFAVAGLLLLLPHFAGIEWGLTGGSRVLAQAVAGLSALFIMFYDGFVMNFSRAIPFWHTRMLPILCLTYAALAGVTLLLTLRELLGGGGAYDTELMRLEYLLLLVNMVLVVVYLRRMSRWEPAARETVWLLLKGPYARAFMGLVIGVGLVATLLLSVAHARVHETWLVILIAACELTGDYALIMVLLKSGLFSPQSAPAYQVGLVAGS